MRPCFFNLGVRTHLSEDETGDAAMLLRVHPNASAAR
jgi:hypothetical protein